MDFANLIPTAITGFGSGMEAAGNFEAADASRMSAQREAVAHQFSAEQARINAGQQIAASQRAAADVRLQGDLLTSRAQALAAASGAGAADPTIVRIMSDLRGATAYRAGVQLYQGEASARIMRMQAAAGDFAAASAIEAGEMKANAFNRAGTAALFKGAASLFSRYGSGAPKPTGDSAFIASPSETGGNADYSYSDFNVLAWSGAGA